MANLIIKPTSGGSLILQDEGGTAANTIDASGNTQLAGTLGVTGASTLTGNVTMAGTANNLGTVTAGTLSSTVTNNAGPMTKIGSGTFTSAANLELAQALGTYLVHQLFLQIKPADGQSGGITLYLRYKIADAWYSTANYNWNMMGINSSSAALNAYVGEGDTAWRMTRDGIRNDSYAGFNITFHNLVPSATPDKPTAISHSCGTNHDGANRQLSQTSYLHLTNSATVQDIRIYPNTGTINGKWQLYGLS